MDIGRIAFKPDVINSLVFYISLGIILSYKGEPPSISEKSLKEYITEGQKQGIFKNSEVLSRYLEKAYSKVSSSTFKIVDMENVLTEGIRVIDTDYGWVSKL